ncbi:MAG: radical SAM protein [Lachnospiraceae bacterium]|nr:radical SAM protein [Lachnospiraceae bacterium]
MKNTKREIWYAKEHFTEVHHTTLNPEGPGVVRIHLIPPVLREDGVDTSVAIINGQDIIPVNVAWSILLIEFMEEVNAYDGKEVTESDYAVIVKNVCKRMKKVYPMVPNSFFKKDLNRILETFKQVAYRQPVEEAVGYMSIGDYAPFMKAPHRMDLLVSAMEKNSSWNCNQRCVHCYAAGQLHASEEELSTEEWKNIIDKCRKAGIPQLTFTGGEPTMREDLFELIASAKWFVTRLNTNGIRLDEEYCRKLKEASLDSLQITFYSSDAEIHNTLVGVKMFEKTAAGIKNALAAGLSVSVNTPLCTLNKDYHKTLEYLHSLGVLYVTCSGLITTGNATKESSERLQLSGAEIKEILKDAVKYCADNGMEISFTSPGWVENSFCEELGINPPTCGACLSNMAITPSGKVVGCQSWLSDEPLGDMLSDAWESIWNSEKCRERRDFSAKMEGTCPLRKMRGELPKIPGELPEIPAAGDEGKEGDDNE